MNKFTISINETGNAPDNQVFIVETQNIWSADDQWVKDLADHLVANPPTSLGWSGPGVVMDISVLDRPRNVAPNP